MPLRGGAPPPDPVSAPGRSAVLRVGRPFPNRSDSAAAAPAESDVAESESAESESAESESDESESAESESAESESAESESAESESAESELAESESAEYESAESKSAECPADRGARQGLPKPVSVQNSYSLLTREFETGLAEVLYVCNVYNYIMLYYIYI